MWCMLKANVSKSAVMVFSREPVDGAWKWGGGEHIPPGVSKKHNWVLILLVLVHGMCISRTC